MIKKENCILLGKITKTHGTRGAVLVWLDDLKAQEVKERESVFVEIDGLLVPFFIENYQEKSQDVLILNIRGVESEIKAREFAGLNVFVLKEKVKKSRKTLYNVNLYKGFRVTDVKLGFVGLACDIEDIANNPLLKVDQEGKEYLIPIHEDIILEINDKKKEITINAPNGLFEI